MFGERSSVLAINGMCSSDSQCVSGNCQGNLCESSLGSKLFSLNTPEECIEASISNLASSSSSSGNSFPGRWVCTNVQANSTTFKSGCLYTSGPSLTNTPFTCTDYTAVSKLTTSKRLDSGSSNSGSYAEGLKDPMSVALLTMQMVFFCLLLMALSCQAFHKKRSIIVHFVLRRSLLTDVFAKYSYTFCLFALPVCVACVLPCMGEDGSPHPLSKLGGLLQT